MSRQSFIDNYFKMKGSRSSPPSLEAKHNICAKKVKKRSLSLIKPITPTKSPKVSKEIKNVQHSDEENIWENSCVVDLTLSGESEKTSESSTSTIIYSPEKNLNHLTRPLINDSPSPTFTPCFSPNTAQESLVPKTELDSCNAETNQGNNNTPSVVKNFRRTIEIENSEDTRQELHNYQTPQKSKVTSTPQSSQPSTSISPRAKEKFFSPTKKRSVVKRTHNTAKRSLGMEMSSRQPCRILFEEDLFTAACDGMDDKTIFLLEIIDKFLNEVSMRKLLTEESQILLTDCLQVVKPGMRLVCRLYWRKEGWYQHEQISTICSKENDPLDKFDFQQAMKSLLEKKLLVSDTTENITFNDYASILKKDDLTQICKELKIKKNSKKGAIEALSTFCKQKTNISNFLSGFKSSNAARVLQMMRLKAGSCYKLSDLARRTLNELYILMYLGMDYTIIREKRLELVLIYDKIKRETYPIDKDMELDNASVVFRTRDEFQRYLTAHDTYEDFLTRTDVVEKCNIVKQVYNLYKRITLGEMESYESLPKWLHRFTPANIYIKILETGIQDLKRVMQYELAVDILTTLINNTTFRQHRKADWYAEKALILHSCLYEHNDAAELLLKGFRCPTMSEEAKDSIRPRARKIAYQKNAPLSDSLKEQLRVFTDKEEILENNLCCKHIYKQPMDRIGKHGKVKFETRTPEGRTMQEAEEYCIDHYKHTGEFTHGEHWEGRIVKLLFSLLFWDIIYSKPAGAKGVFLSHYQLCPLDLFTDAFYDNRKKDIDSRLSVIEAASEEKLSSLLDDAWNNRPEGELSEFPRGGITLNQVKEVSSCLRPSGVAALCSRLGRHYRYARSGFPDLTLWHVTDRRIKFVEVKTDSDKPSMKQIQWMQYMRERGVATEFCYVGVHTTRQRSRHKPGPDTTALPSPRPDL
ncbi:fanconi-associated nuclease 1-like [Pectinophora gossypiella]|uniref:Fanconi-associated nuclease n=1 Tax=Pectinophora gossypiella TaxID=13191 RepID=A0A1E1W4E8_PECGO|nr:fanconi-associated nuclease 1-like [Pectinophora gossypiella]